MTLILPFFNSQNKKVLTGSAPADPIHVLTDEYTSFATTNGYEIMSEPAIYNEYLQLVNDGNINKRRYHFIHNGAVKKDGNNRVSRVLGLIKIDGVYPEWYNDVANTQPLWTATHIDFETSRRLDLDSTGLGKLSLTHQYDAHIFNTQNLGWATFAQCTRISDAAFAWRTLIILSRHSTTIWSESGAADSAASSSTIGQEFYLDAFHNYKLIHERGLNDACFRYVRRNDGTADATDSTAWDKNMDAAHRLTMVSHGRFLSYKIQTMIYGEL